MTVLAAHAWPTNAELIADVAKLYIGDELFTDADLDVALAPMFAYHHDQEQ